MIDINLMINYKKRNKIIKKKKRDDHHQNIYEGLSLIIIRVGSGMTGCKQLDTSLRVTTTLRSPL